MHLRLIGSNITYRKWVFVLKLPIVKSHFLHYHTLVTDSRKWTQLLDEL